MRAPENELPVALPQNVLVARTDDAVVALLGMHVCSTGLAFDLSVRVRPGSPSGTELHDVLWRHGPGAPPLLLGLELADGTRVDDVGEPEWGGDVVFTQTSGSGSEYSVDHSWWLSPVPPAGPLTVVVWCPELGLPETSTVLDGTAIRVAADRVVALWPWEPPRRRGPDQPPSPPEIPEDSWFARR
ncbi:hypothetical protein [Geodermatophilus maliterrae]|uniref:Uncharacterized protein n=1 Tax=Geodermatophilus maliterrae TaxID=3162531 RepID=A0ABV3XFN4_9ACTN